MTSTLTHLTFDCTDAAALASFWAAVLDQPIDDGASPEYALVKGTPGWMFLQVPEPKAAKNRMHADLTSDDLAAELVRLKDLARPTSPITPRPVRPGPRSPIRRATSSMSWQAELRRDWASRGGEHGRDRSRTLALDPGR